MAYLKKGNTFPGVGAIGVAMNVGEDDTGYDVKFFGASSGAYMLCD